MQVTVQEALLIQYLRFLNMTSSGKEQQDAILKAVNDYFIRLNSEDK